MTLEDFRTLVGRLQREIPAQFERGVADIEVSLKTVPHPVRQDVYTLGECVPLSWSGNGADLHSKIVLYYGSFDALARQEPGFDWRGEVWDTLTHELRHHLEFRAHVGRLEAYDWAAEQNFARHEGQVFDPVFYRSGERVADGIYKVDDDVFLEIGGRGTGDAGRVSFRWHGRDYRAIVKGIEPPAFLTLEGLADEPHGDAVLVLRKKFSFRDFWRLAAITQRTVVVEPIDG